MSIGTKIFELRKAMNLSQEELADMLDVSRQSVSKWETDAAVPDLEKLCKLCDVFDITLDELAGREMNRKNNDNANTSTEKTEHPTAQQKIIGYILLSVSLFAGILIWIFAENEDQLYIPLPIIVSALTCSLICLFVKEKAGYWCAWSAAAPIVLFSPHTVGLPALSLINTNLIAFAIIMALVARKLFENKKITINRKKNILVIFGWTALIGLRVVSYVSVLNTIISSSVALLPYVAVDLIVYVGTSLLLTYTVCYITNVKRNG